jgi:hypothetical protein
MRRDYNIVITVKDLQEIPDFGQYGMYYEINGKPD